jgi:hypothetical protein
MAERGTPWWFSGDPTAGQGAMSDESGAERSAESGMSLGSLIAGAQQLFDWASELVLAPHADHADPREHPECLICKGTSLVQGVRAEPAPMRRQREISWIPVERQGF